MKTIVDYNKCRITLANHGIRLVQATEPEVYGRWDWIDDVGNNASDMSFATEEEAMEDAVDRMLNN